MNRARALFLAPFLLAAAAGCGHGKSPAVQPAPDFTLTDITGKKHTLSALKGQVVLVDFWATWCPPCISSIPLLEELFQEYKDKGVQVLGVDMDDDVTEVAPFAKELGMTYPVLLGGQSDVGQLYRISALPALYLINQKGHVVRRWVGFDPGHAKEWRAAIDSLLTK